MDVRDELKDLVELVGVEYLWEELLRCLPNHKLQEFCEDFRTTHSMREDDD